MLPPENQYGNIEYKRYIIPSIKLRFIQLETQMNWRLNEGNGIAFYYIGVDDDGKIVNIIKEHWLESKKNLEKITKSINAKIDLIEEYKLNDNIYYIVKIKKNINICWNEKRILLIGDTLTGKTSFLAYIIKNKLGIKSNLYMHYHKHELETGKTSSFNYHKIHYNNTRIVFIDTPGYNNYHKTRQKIISSIDFDLVLLFFKSKQKWNYEPYYQKLFYNLKIPVLRINIFSKKNRFPQININKPINRKKLLNHIYKNILEENTENNNKLLFNIITSYPHKEMGIIISGFLKSGSIKKNQELIFYENKKYNIKIKSIHLEGRPINEINKKSIFTILLKINNYNKKPLGFLSNNNYRIKTKITIKLLYLIKPLLKKFNCYFGNKIIEFKLLNIKNNILKCIVNSNNKLYINNKFIIGDYFFGIIS